MDIDGWIDEQNDWTVIQMEEVKNQLCEYISKKECVCTGMSMHKTSQGFTSVSSLFCEQLLLTVKLF